MTDLAFDAERQLMINTSNGKTFPRVGPDAHLTEEGVRALARFFGLDDTGPGTEVARRLLAYGDRSEWL